MQTPPFLTSLNTRLSAADRTMTRRETMLSFLLVRFVLMSGMVVGFSWWALHLSP